MHLPCTKTLRAFVTTARLGSLTAACERVAMSPPALSRRLASLEVELGVRLLERLPRGVVLTSAGERYLAHAVAVLDRLQDAASQVQQDSAMVRVTTIPAFATRWLLPRQTRFRAAHPDITVDVRTSTSFERLDTGEYDLGIRLALDREIEAEPLLPIHVMPVWSSAHPRAIARPEDVLEHPLIGPDVRPEFWLEWFRSVGLERFDLRPRGIDSLLVMEQTLTGSAVAIGMEPLISTLLSDGRLASLTAYRLRSARSFFLVKAPGKLSRAARLFSNWLEVEAGT